MTQISSIFLPYSEIWYYRKVSPRTEPVSASKIVTTEMDSRPYKGMYRSGSSGAWVTGAEKIWKGDDLRYGKFKDYYSGINI
jgi:hypothetical protein